MRECVTHHICDCNRERMDALEAALARAEGIVGRARSIQRVWKRLCQCYDEFTEESPEACSEYQGDLDGLIVQLCYDLDALESPTA